MPIIWLNICFSVKCLTEKCRTSLLAMRLLFDKYWIINGEQINFFGGKLDQIFIGLIHWSMTLTSKSNCKYAASLHYLILLINCKLTMKALFQYCKAYFLWFDTFPSQLEHPLTHYCCWRSFVSFHSTQLLALCWCTWMVCKRQSWAVTENNLIEQILMKLQKKELTCDVLGITCRCWMGNKMWEKLF